MSRLKPFRGLRPPHEFVEQVAALPYDVVETEEARAFSQGNPRSFFHISRPEVGFPPGIDAHSDAVYARGAENLAHFIQQGWLQRDRVPSFYVYRQRMGAHVQTGLVAAASLNEYDVGRIKKHELTRADKEEDRTRHVEALGGNDEPVFLTYRAVPEIDALISRVIEGAPEYDFVTPDGIGHTLWVVRSEWTALFEKAFEAVPCLYIADGHHRSAAAARVRKQYQRAFKGKGGHDVFLAVVFPHDQLQILAYHRLVKDLNGLSSQAFLRKLEEAFEVGEVGQKAPVRLHDFGMYLDRRWYRLSARPGTYAETSQGVLDVSILQKNVLGPLLGIGDPRTDARIQFVGGIHGVDALERRVDGGLAQVAFALFPTTLAQLLAIADEGEIMPPKSTWFEPKLRSGLVLHLFS